MQETPLYDEHIRAGGKIIDFHGWALPLKFSGILEEHQHVRRRAGIFDCSHMGKFFIRGERAIRAFSDLVIADITRLTVGKCRYTALLNSSGGIIDDCVVLRLSEQVLFLVSNAAPIDAAWKRLSYYVPEIENVSDAFAKIDIQGPLSPKIMEVIGFSGIASLKFWTGNYFSWQGSEGIVTRAGYTGELGYEIFLPPESAVSLWQAFLAQSDVVPCGLGARDTLRTEMAYPLSGQDVDETRTPLEASMERFIDWESNFPGKEVLLAQKESGAYKGLVPLKSHDKRAPRPGFELRLGRLTVGVVTSGTYGPSVGVGIGLGYVQKSLSQPGMELETEPRSLKVCVETAPIYKKATGRNRVVAG